MEPTPNSHEANTERFLALFKQHESGIVRSLKYQIWDDHAVEESLQEAMIIGWKKFDQLRDEASFAGWMLSIAQNAFYNMQKKTDTIGRNDQKYFERNREEEDEISEKLDPSSIILNAEECKVAEKLFLEAPPDLRVVFGLYHASDLSMAQIAKMLSISESTVRQRLESAQAFFGIKLRRILVAFLVLQFDEPKVQAMTDRFLANLPQTGAATTGAAASASSVSKAVPSLFSVLSLIVAHFVYVLGLLFCGQACGTAVFRESASLKARRWLIKRFFVLYCAVLAFPCVILLVSGINAFFFPRQPIPGITTTIIGLYGVAFIAYLTGVAITYRKMLAGNPDAVDPEEGDFLKLKRFINRGLVGCTVLIVFTFAAYLVFFINDISETINPSSHSNQKFFELTILFVLLAGIVIIVHLRSAFLFWRLLNASQDRESMVSFTADSATTNRFRRILHETAFLSPFALFTLVPGIMHLIFYQTRVVHATSEFLLFLVLWIWVLSQNLATPQQRWWRILGMFALQFLAMNLYRELFL